MQKQAAITSAVRLVVKTALIRRMKSGRALKATRRHTGKTAARCAHGMMKSKRLLAPTAAAIFGKREGCGGNHMTRDFFVIVREAQVLWVNKNRPFWVHQRGSQLLHHVGVMRYLTYFGATQAVGLYGGHIMSGATFLRGCLHPDGSVSIVTIL